MSTDVMIHVRFAPDGTVMEIGERPASCTAQQWFNFLTRQSGLSYLTLSGGRAVFRITPETMGGLRDQAVAEVAA